MRIGIIGAGAVGAFFGAGLARAGHEVIVLARGRTLETVKSKGLIVEGGVVDTDPVPVKAVGGPAELTAADGKPVDMVLLAVKATGRTVDERRAELDALLDGIPGEPPVATTQNSVEVHRLVADIVGEQRTRVGVVRGFFIHTGPATVRFDGGIRSFTVGLYGGDGSTRDAGLAELSASLGEAGIDGIVRDDVWHDIWEKAMFVTCFGALGAVAERPVGVLRTDLRGSLVALMDEVAAAARATGVDLSDDVVDRTMGFTDAVPADSTSSMQRDITDGDAGELDSQVGAISRAGRRGGVPTPLHDLLGSLLALRVQRQRV